MNKKIASLRLQEIPRKNSVGHADSVEKILWQLSLLSPDPVRYQSTSSAGRILAERVYDIPVDRVIISPTLFRQFICTAGCTACCQKFTLDYTPSEYETLVELKEGFERRTVWVNGKKKWVMTNDQNLNSLCDFLRVEKPIGGLGCAHWPNPPLSCISAPQLQFIQMRQGSTYVLKKPFGRAWAMTPTPQCAFVEVSNFEAMQIPHLIQILDRFSEWARYFGIRTCLSSMKREMNKVLKSQTIPALGITVWSSTEQ